LFNYDNNNNINIYFKEEFFCGGYMADLSIIVLSILELLGVICALFAIMMGLTKGREALKLTGGGMVEVTVTYLLIACGLYLASYGLRFIGAVGESWIFNAAGAIIAFGMGFCFFMIFKKVIDHLEQLKKFSI
jgi:hypothetical protein